MTTATFGTSEAVSDREILTTRVVGAPRDRVFDAWTTAGELARWWGPKGFTNTFNEFDPRPEGQWRFVMHGPDGTAYKNHSVFLEVVRPERIVFRHVSGPHYLATVTFTEQGQAATLITWRMRFENPKAFADLKPLIIEGNIQNLDKLEAVLARPLS